MTSLAILFTGFSIFSALSIALTHFRSEHYREQGLSRIMGLILLLALSGLQLAHFAQLYLDQDWSATWPYRTALFVVAPSFFLFSRPLLRPLPLAAPTPALLAHALPVLLAPWLPGHTALPLAFGIGAAYLLWLAYSLYALRGERARFHLEMLLLGAVFAIALGVSVLGLVQANLAEKLFFSLYASAIGLAFLLVQTVLGIRPQLANEVRESAQAAYANSTLGNVNCAAALTELDRLIQGEKLHLDAGLNLPGLAAHLGLSPHQLSELMNARLGKSFSRYLREQRIASAKAMLCAEPAASVLSVGLSCGFTAQSNFYEAFREIEGMTPGQYRKLHCRSTSG